MFKIYYLQMYCRPIFALLFLRFFTVPFFGIMAQDNELFFERYSRTEGLSQNSVYAITQDQFDFIWLGTGKGLNRFDGYSFINYYHDFEDKESISSSRVVDIKVDKWNRLWLGTDGGLNYFDREKEVFYAYNKIANDSTSLSGDRIKCILIDKKGFLWVGTRTGLNVSRLPLDSIKNLTTDKLKFKRINSSSLSNNLITTLFEDHDGDIWAGTINGLNKIERNSYSVKQYFPASEYSEFLLGNHITSIIQDNKKILWIGTQNGLYHLNKANNTFRNLKNHSFFKKNIRANSVSSLLLDNLSRIWIGTSGGGLLQYHPKVNNFTVEKNDEGNVHSLANNHVFALFEDHSKNLFVSTFALGFSVTNIKSRKFSLYLHEKHNHNKITTNDVRSIYFDDKNHLWLGIQNNGLYNLDLINKKHTHIEFGQLKQNGISPTIKSIYKKDSTYLWLGTLTKGLLLFNKNNNIFREYKYIENGIAKSISYIFDIKKDKLGNLWIASWKDGLFKLPHGSKKFIRYTNNKDDASSISNNNITSIYIDSENNVWLTTWGGGINVLNPDSGKFRNYRMNRKRRNSLLSDYCTTLYVDRDGIYWIGTTEGLCRFNDDSEEFTHFEGKHLVFNEIIFSIEEDKQSNLWISTDLGLSRFSKHPLSAINYDKTNGIQGNEHYIGSSCKIPDGRLAFGGKNGLTLFHPDSISFQVYNSPVIITNFQLSYKNIKVNKEYEGQIILKKSILTTDTLYLSHKNNVLSFEFATCSYQKPQTIQYAFMLKGFENEWNYVSSDRRVATYTNLNPGKYVLQLKATNSAGEWNPQNKKLFIIIESPIWQTTWFRIAVFLALIMFVLIIIRMRTIILVRKKAILEKQVKERTHTIHEKNIQLANQNEESVVQAEELRSISEQLQYLNNQLENQVKERTEDLNTALEKAEDAQRLISSFLTNMSHELRTPMNAISGFSQLITSVDISDSEKQKYVGVINTNIQTLITLIENVMDVAKLHTNQYKFKSSVFNFSDLCNEIYMGLNENKSLIKEDVKFIYSPDKQSNILFYSDQKAFRHIIYNLLDNALKYTDSGKVEINFSYKLNNPDHSNNEVLMPELNGKVGKLTIVVSDTGVGIKKEDQQYIFDSFKKLEHNKKKLFRGTGLGLALVKNLTDKLYGEIDLESQVNVGTKVSISIPLSRKK